MSEIICRAAARLIIEDGADVHGFSSICSSYPLTIRIAQAVKAARPDSIVLLGGPQASVVDLQTLAAFRFVDFVIRGEAELALPVFLDELANERKLSRVPSLSYRWQSKPRRNPGAPVLEDLDSIPLPAYHLVGGLRGATKASLELGRGCPFACTFCSTNDFFRRRFRLRSPNRVLSDMRALAAAYGVREFELVHDMFTVDRRRVEAFCEAMLASGEAFRWACSARTDCVDEELLALMSRAGCMRIFFGVETGSPKLQKIIDKHLDLDWAEQIIITTEQLGMSSTVSLITGFPEETREDLEQTLQMFMVSARCPHSVPQLNVLAPLAETPLYSKYRDQLTLGELCSDMSRQGASQDVEDLGLIETYPEIFPNFYLIPAPYLDLECILELREFALNGVGHFRWLLLAIHQTTKEIFEFFLAWRKHRVQMRSNLWGLELRRYYRTDDFRQDFICFVRSNPAADNEIVQVFLEYADALKDSKSPTALTGLMTEPILLRDKLCWSDFPVRSNDISLVELSCNIQRVIDGLKLRTEPTWERGSHFYMASERSGIGERFHQISTELGRLLQVCDGQLSIEGVSEQLSTELREIDEALRRYVIVHLLEGARAEGLIDVYRSSTYQPESKVGTIS